MNEKSDVQLLRDYAEHSSEAAFGKIVTRHTDLVYSAALRQVNSSNLAADIAQEVFMDLARKAKSVGGRLAAEASLAGWLHRATRYAALNHLRDTRRQRATERQAMEQVLTHSESSADWEQIRPLLDEALDSLGDEDREALLLRYFKNRDFRTVGLALGISDDAAQKRASRAVERLREFFSKRNVTIGASGLVVLISANAVQSAPIAIVTTISAAAPTKGIASAGKFMTLAKGFWKPVLTAAPVIGTVYFLLKAELESARSPRERRFLLRMIWLRFSVAAFVLLCGVVLIPLVKKHTDLMAIGGVVGFFFLAVASAARTMCFHYRRRQIQVEDGTWEPFDLGQPTKADELLGDLLGKSSKADSFAALSAVFGFVGCLVLIPLIVKRLLASGYWMVAALLLIWGGFAAFRWLRNWRHRPRRVFDARFRMIAGPVAACALLSLVFFDLLWAQGRLQFGTEWCLVINLAVVAAYAALIRVLAHWQNKLVK